MKENKRKLSYQKIVADPLFQEFLDGIATQFALVLAKKKITRHAVLRKAGLSGTTIYRITDSKLISIPYLFALAKAVGKRIVVRLEDI